MNTRPRSKRQIAELTQATLRELLDYDQDTGRFTWKVRAARNVFPGDIAGSDIGQGYVTIAICGRHYRAHRLAWLYVYGQWPQSILDHINGERDDNRIANLREASHSLNVWNSRHRAENNATGVVGVHMNRGKYRAVIHANKKRHHLGTFASLKEAAQVYEAARKRLHVGAFA